MEDSEREADREGSDAEGETGESEDDEVDSDDYEIDYGKIAKENERYLKKFLLEYNGMTMEDGTWNTSEFSVNFSSADVCGRRRRRSKAQRRVLRNFISVWRITERLTRRTTNVCAMRSGII